MNLLPVFDTIAQHVADARAEAAAGAPLSARTVDLLATFVEFIVAPAGQPAPAGANPTNELKAEALLLVLQRAESAAAMLRLIERVRKELPAAQDDPQRFASLNQRIANYQQDYQDCVARLATARNALKHA